MWVGRETEKSSYHRVQLPQTSPIAWFHPNTATGKLNAVMIPTSPRGFHVSSSTWPGPARGRREEEKGGVRWWKVFEENAFKIFITKLLMRYNSFEVHMDVKKNV